MKIVKEVMQAKGSQLHKIRPDSMVLDALEQMAENEVGALLVMEGDCLLGILSERDYARKVIIQGKASKETPVRDIMATEVLVVNPDTTLEECMAIMTQKYVRHLPVLEKGAVVGIISIGDVVKSIISDQHFTINNLVQYIMGG
jgi:CBS domain-containing protein